MDWSLYSREGRHHRHLEQPKQRTTFGNFH